MGRCAEGTLILSYDPGAVQRLRPASLKLNDEFVIHPHRAEGSGAGRNKGEQEGTSFHLCGSFQPPLEVNEEY